jgi:hypothetical protein
MKRLLCAVVAAALMVTLIPNVGVESVEAAGAAARVVLSPTIAALGADDIVRYLDGATWQGPQLGFWNWAIFIGTVVAAFGTAWCRNNSGRWGC